jgi:hypothetical protein
MSVSRRGFLKKLAQVVVGGTLSAAGGYGYSTQIEPEWLTIERLQLPIRGLHSALEGLRIVQMSDFHLHPHTQIELIQQAVRQANELKPDLVVLTGDYVQQGAESIYELAPVLAGLQAKYGVYTILGNHDLWTNIAVVRGGLQQAGLPVLVNEGLALAVGKATLYLAGLDDAWSGKPDLNAALHNRPEAGLTILLAHEPDFADLWSQDGRIALQLAGHSHGGQVRLPGLGAPILPRFGKKYDQGLYQVGGMWLYTTRGVGLGFVPVRFNCPPEITEITLVSA